MTTPTLCRHGGVSFVDCRADAREHELQAQREIARRLAQLLGCPFNGEVRDGKATAARVGYAVPNDTLTFAQAQRLGLFSEHDLFGGVVPEPFVATKVISHPLASAKARARAPEGWSAAFAERVSGATLPGWSAFSADDARQAARALLHGGPVRLKLADDRGGTGQAVVRDPAQLDAALAAFGERVQRGMVIERDLQEVRTLSIGLLQAGGLRVSYHGTQRLTRNRRGEPVYGGSSLTFVRGGFEALHRAAHAGAHVRQAIDLAQSYHAAALDCFAGMFASRCNYDVAFGTDAGGTEHAGVLESSWRIGGASGAEVLALQALSDDASLQVTHASTVEVHGQHAAPPDALLLFRGVDEHLGPIIKYAKAGLHDEP